MYLEKYNIQIFGKKWNYQFCYQIKLVNKAVQVLGAETDLCLFLFTVQ